MASIASLAAVDEELAAIAKRSYPSDDDEARRAREREEENAYRAEVELRELKKLVRDAVDGAFGRALRDEARAILLEGTPGVPPSETQLKRVRKLVREWRRAGRARKAAKKK
jgi:hypothetical protein